MKGINSMLFPPRGRPLNLTARPVTRFRPGLVSLDERTVPSANLDNGDPIPPTGPITPAESEPPIGPTPAGDSVVSGNTGGSGPPQIGGPPPDTTTLLNGYSDQLSELLELRDKINDDVRLLQDNYRLLADLIAAMANPDIGNTDLAVISGLVGDMNDVIAINSNMLQRNLLDYNSMYDNTLALYNIVDPLVPDDYPDSEDIIPPPRPPVAPPGLLPPAPQSV